MSLYNLSGATFSDCRKYRYVLWRVWDKDKPSVMFIGLNPSTANESTDDPTIRRVIGMANGWGFGSVHMLNLFAFVTPYPEELLKCTDPIGDNDRYLKTVSMGVSEIVFAWGNFKEAKDRAKKVIEMFPWAKALVINKDGSPRHPLYVPANTPLIEYLNQKQQLS